MLNKKVTRVRQFMLALLALIGFVAYDHGNFASIGALA